MRCTFSLELDADAYERHYQSETYPRFRRIEYGGPKTGMSQKQARSEKLLVDFLPCADLAEVATRLNEPPSKQRVH